MATVTGTIWSEKTVYNGQPKVNSTATYEYEKNGSQLKIKVDVDNHCISSTAFWDWRWAFSVSIGGQDIAYNIQLKPRTYSTIIGTTHYAGSTGWVILDIGSAGSVDISIKFFDTQAYDNDTIHENMGGGTYTLTKS